MSTFALKSSVKMGSIGLAVALATSACGAAANSTGGGNGSNTAVSPAVAATSVPASGKCGSVPTNRGVQDQTGVIKGLGGDYSANYNGFDLPLAKSAWANWKPSKTSGFTVGVAFGPLSNGNNTLLYNNLVDALKKTPGVSKVIPYTTTGTDVSEQLQKYQSLVQQKVDLIVYEPLASEAFVSQVQEAAKAGIPSLAINGEVNTPDSVNFTPNAYLYGAIGGAYLMRLLGGSGNILEVQGVPSVDINAENLKGFSDAIKLCSGVKVAGQVTGNFDPGAAQSAVLQFLGSHPQPVNGVWEAGAMANGVTAAFKKLGRTMPPLASSSTTKGYLAYLAANPNYGGMAVEVDAGAEGQTAAYVAGKMLAGDGVKVNSIVVSPAEIYASNASTWNPGTDTTSEDAPTGPASLAASMKSYVDKLFTK